MSRRGIGSSNLTFRNTSYPRGNPIDKVSPTVSLRIQVPHPPQHPCGFFWAIHTEGLGQHPLQGENLGSPEDSTVSSLRAIIKIETLLRSHITAGIDPNASSPLRAWGKSPGDDSPCEQFWERYVFP